MMEQWNDGILGAFVFHPVEKLYGSRDKQIVDRKNIKRGFKKLRVWQDAIALYVLAYKIFSKFPFKLKKVAGNPAVAGLFIAFIEKSQKAIVISGTYKNIHGEIVTIDPKSLDSNAEVMRF